MLDMHARTTKWRHVDAVSPLAAGSSRRSVNDAEFMAGLNPLLPPLQPAAKKT